MTERPGLIGRGRELATLEQALDDAEHSGSGWVSVVGEPGIGKTRLVGELCARTEARGGLALAGGGSELELDLPYGAFADAFDDYLGALDPGRLKTVLGVEIDALAGVFPALARHAQAGSELSGQRHRIHRTVRALLGRLADDRSFVLALDDLHWADLASLELILYLTRHPPPGNGLLLVLTWRASADNRLGAALASGRSARHAAVELAPLTQPELAELVGVDMDAARLGAIYRASGGNPFYAEELARLGPNAGPDEHDAGLPRSVAGAIGSEVAGLPAPARRLAQAAAVAGDPFGPELAAACAALDEREALAALDQLLARTIIISAGSPRRFRFRHPIVRLAVYESAGVGWRLAAHARAAAALAEWGAPLTARAHHLALAAAPGDDDAAQLLADAAAGVQAHAPATAAGWLQAALRLLPQQAEHEQHRCELLSTLAAALGAQGQLVQARAALLEAVNTCPRRAGLVADLAGIEHALGHFDQSGPRLRAALARLPAGAATERARLGVELAFSRLAHLDFEGALEQAALAAELATDLNPPLYGAARAMGAFVAAAAALPQAREQRLQAAAIIDTLDDHELQRQLAGAYYLGRAEHLLEDLEASARHLGRAITVARASGSSAQLVLLGREHARVLAFCGRLNEARQEAETALASARISGQPWALGCALTAHATVLRSTGELDDAIASAEEAVSLIATGTVPAAAVLEVGIRRQLALIALDTGQPERCLQELTRLGLPERGPAEPSVLCELYEAATAAELACGRLDAAQAWAEAAEHVATRLELPLSRALALSAQGRCQLAAGHPQRAAQAALKAAAGASSAGAHLQAARCQLLAGEALIESGQLETAEQELQSAATAFARSGARRDHERAATQLRRLGATVAAPLPAHPLGADLRTLSAREREIAELVARGHTNRRIAAELYISRKTVETHLRNIFEKLAVHNRTSMVRILERDRRTAI